MEGNIIFDQFVDVILKEIDSYLPQNEQHEVEIITANKNNLSLTGLAIRREESPVAPTIYLESYFIEHLQGEPIEDICASIAQLYEESIRFEFKIENFADYDNVKDRLRLQMVSKEHNGSFLSQGPYILHEVGAVVPYIDISKEAEGSMTIRVTHQLMEDYGVSKEELFQTALENTQLNRPCTFERMEDVIRDGLGDEFIDEELEEIDMPMYVLSNVQRSNGATVMLYPDILKQVGEEVGSNYYVLPSSTHEVIIVPKNRDTPSPKDLRETVQEVNATQIEPVDYLSGEVYEFNRARQTLDKCQIAERGLER